MIGGPSDAVPVAQRAVSGAHKELRKGEMMWVIFSWSASVLFELCSVLWQCWLVSLACKNLFQLSPQVFFWVPAQHAVTREKRPVEGKLKVKIAKALDLGWKERF